MGKKVTLRDVLRGVGVGAQQYGGYMADKANQDMAYAERQQSTADEQAFRRQMAQEAAAAYGARLDREYGLREQLARAQHPTIKLPVFGDLGVTASGLAEMMRASTYQQSVNQQGNRPHRPQRDYLGEKIAFAEWERNNPPPPKPAPTTDPSIARSRILNVLGGLASQAEADALGPNYSAAIGRAYSYVEQGMDEPSAWAKAVNDYLKYVPFENRRFRKDVQPHYVPRTITIDPTTGEPIEG